MIANTFILTNIVFVTSIYSLCFTPSQKEREMKAINSSLKELFNNDQTEFLPEVVMKEKKLQVKSFGSGMIKVCPSYKGGVISKLDQPQKQILGSGTYGKVFLANLPISAVENKHMAIKLISLKSYLKIKAIVMTQTEELTECIENVVAAVKDAKAILDNEKNSSEENAPGSLYVFEAISESCKNMYIGIKKPINHIKRYLEVIRSEIKTSKIFKDLVDAKSKRETMTNYRTSSTALSTNIST